MLNLAITVTNTRYPSTQNTYRILNSQSSTHQTKTINTPNTNWAYMIHELQASKGYSLSQIAKESRLSLKTIKKLAEDKSTPNLETFQKLLNFYCFVFYNPVTQQPVF